MEQMATSSSGDSDQMAKLGKAPAAMAQAQGLPSHPPLKCPRCDSSNTKFCYYNNYSQTQPRHFCKSCRRYWTQGGMLRNVPIGGGCRKNKRVRPRSLIAMGPLDHGPGPFTDATSSMLGRLGSIPSFGSACDDTGSQLLNIAFARFQETLRQPQQPAQTADTAAYPDMSLPALVHKPCGISTCSGLMMDGFDHGLSFQQALHADQSFHRPSYEMPNPALYSQTHNLMATSATATLDSLEDELSSFSNFQYHVNPINLDVPTEEKAFNLPVSTPHWLLARPPSLEHGGSHLSYIDAPLQGPNADLRNENAEDEKPVKENVKPMIDMNGQNRLSLLMPADNIWHQQHHQQNQPSSMNEILFNESHHGMVWPTNTARWQDMHTTSVL